MLTSTPATSPASSIGALTTTAVSMACRTKPTINASGMTTRSPWLGETPHDGADDEVPAVDHHEEQNLERQRDHRRRQLHHAHREQRGRHHQVDEQQRNEEKEPHLKAGLQL